MKRRMRGESMVSLLIGLAVGLLVISGGIHLWMTSLQSQRTALQASQLAQDLRVAMDWIVQDIRRAQYVNAAWRTRINSTCNDAFCGAAEDFRVSANQIEFSWDRDDDGKKKNNECAGFQLKSFELIAKTACGPVVWTAITDAGNIKVTALQFTSHCSWVQGTLLRHITIQITGALPSDPKIIVNQKQSIALHNAAPATALASDCS
jgi:type IV pilus assembly protein PilW